MCIRDRLRNQQHFGQAQGTPFSTAPLKDIKTLDQLQQLSPQEVNSEAVCEIIQYLRQTPALPIINTTITSTDLYQMYSVWSENTTTSPSGLHLGHDKCPIKYQDDSSSPALFHRLFHIKAEFINLALTNGIVYPRWQHINTIMIEKLPGNYHVNKLRALHIFESDINAIFGILWGRRLMFQAEQSQVLNESQHGSRKGRSTDTLLIIKHLTYALWRLTQTNGMSTMQRRVMIASL